MSHAGLKYSAPKCSFGLKDIPYLGYVITRYRIKYYPKKLQGIIYIIKSTTMTKVRAPIVVVYYNMYMWPGRYRILDPLTKAAAGPKGRNTLE